MFSIPNVPDRLAREIYAELCGTLPPPSPDTPEARTIRDERAMAAVAALIPENPFEAELATQIVAQVFHAKHALRDASRPNLTVDARNNYRNQASRMDRDSQSGVRNLLRVQAVRYKAEDAARPAAMERAGYWYKDSLEMAGRPLPCSKRNRPTTRRRPANRPTASRADGPGRTVRRNLSPAGRADPRLWRPAAQHRLRRARARPGRRHRRQHQPHHAGIGRGGRLAHRHLTRQDAIPPSKLARHR